MTAPILVTGGTGTLGRHVVAGLRATGAPVRVLSRQHHEPAAGVEYAVGQLDTGEGVDAALSGVDTVVHCAGSRTGDGERAATLVRSAARAGVRHVVNVSVVGADRVPVTSRADRACSATSPTSAPPRRCSPARKCRGRPCGRPSSTSSSS